MSVARKVSKLGRDEKIYGLCFVALPIISFLLFVLIPIITSVYLSMCEWTGYGDLSNAKFIFLDNFKALFNFSSIYAKDLLLAVKNTVIMMAYIPITIALALLLAMALNGKIPGVGFFRVVYYIPGIASAVAVTILFNNMFQNAGLINQLFGSKVEWLYRPNTSKIVIIIMLTWKNLGYTMVLYLAGLQGINKGYYEAAQLDGANSFQQFMKITLPLIQPMTFYIVVTSVIGGLQIFTEPYVLFSYNDGWGPEKGVMSIMVLLYNQYSLYDKMGLSSAIAWVLAFMIFFVTMIQFYFNKKRGDADA